MPVCECVDVFVQGGPEKKRESIGRIVVGSALECGRGGGGDRRCILSYGARKEVRFEVLLWAL